MRLHNSSNAFLAALHASLDPRWIASKKRELVNGDTHICKEIFILQNFLLSFQVRC